MLAEGRGRTAARVERVLGRVVWGILALGLAAGAVVESLGVRASSQGVLLALLGVFFVACVVRLVAAAVAHPGRRRALVALAVGLCLWAVGSTILTASGALTTTPFPAPWEWFFLSSYLGMATFLLLDVPRRTAHQGTIWLEAAVVCGGAASLAGAVVLTPVALAFPDGSGGVRLLLALLYPLLSLLLATLVVGQVVLRQRDRSWRTALLVGGFVSLAIADSSLALNLSEATYVSNLVIELLYGAAFAQLVTAACLPRRDLAVTHPRRQRTRTLIAASAIALAALAFRPSGVATWYVTVPALLTLVAAGWRLVLALREAQVAAEAVRLSRTDELTGLPNRRAVLTDLEGGLHDDEPLALMLLDLDGFKDINDSLGHAAGDAVLEVAAARLESLAGPGVSIARLGGDEFAVLAREDDQAALVELAGRLREVLLEPVRVEGLELAIRASVGITVKSGSDTGATDLLRRADVAMYEAKLHRAGTLLYDASRDGFSRQRLRLSEDLRRAISEDQLVVWYQPQIDALTQRVIGVEALVRWEHPSEGLLLPVHFLPDARRSGLMLALSEVVAYQVVADARRWRDAGFDFRVSMNCAPPELLGGGLLPRLFEAVADAGLPSDSLLVEVTEDSFLSDPERAREALLAIRNEGVQVAIDDYGTGFSSLAYLRDLPVQELKMDRTFVGTLRSDERSRLIVSSTTQMAHAMGLRMVAEGVEDAATAAELVAMDVDVVQGHLVAEPMVAGAVGPWVRRWSASRIAALGGYRRSAG